MPRSGHVSGRQRRRPTRRFVAAIAVGAAALALSGCSWGTFQTLRLLPVGYEMTVHKSNSDQIIYGCSNAHPGDSTGRANCALDTIRLLCTSQPLPGFSPQECQGDTSHWGNTESMKQAISDVLGSDDCLGYHDWIDQGENRFWAGVPAGHGVVGGIIDCP